MTLPRQRVPDFWADLNPLWMFRAQPSDFVQWNGATSVLCRGVYHPLGYLGLFMVHLASFRWLAWKVVGGDFRLLQLIALIPLLMLWALFGSADVRFRIQRPTCAERDGFDTAVLGWFGYLVYLSFYWIAVPLSFVWAVWHYLARILG